MIFSDLETITKGIGVITAAFAMIGGGVTMLDKFQSNDILTWAPEYFEISDGDIAGNFDVVVAREKHRDDCKVKDFTLEVKDSKHHVHVAIPSIAQFSGPESDRIDKFGFHFTIDAEHKDMIAAGPAELLGQIEYECPEGPVVVHYPPNLVFNIVKQ